MTWRKDSAYEIDWQEGGFKIVVYYEDMFRKPMVARIFNSNYGALTLPKNWIFV